MIVGTLQVRNMQGQGHPQPREIRRHGAHDVEILWNSGEEAIYPARFLRGACPCASCVDEVTGKRIVTPDLLPILVYPTKIEPVGRYAIQIYWSDGHSTGIYTWERLYEMMVRLRSGDSGPRSADSETVN